MPSASLATFWYPLSACTATIFINRALRKFFPSGNIQVSSYISHKSFLSPYIGGGSSVYFQNLLCSVMFTYFGLLGGGCWDSPGLCTRSILNCTNSPDHAHRFLHVCHPCQSLEDKEAAAHKYTAQRSIAVRRVHPASACSGM